MSTEWYTREYELYTVAREYELHTREYELYTREYWIKVNLVLVPHTGLEHTPSHFVSFSVQNVSKVATHAICMTDFHWRITESR